MAVHFWDGFNSAPPSCRRAVASVGNFDGVHLGHVQLVREAHKLARHEPVLAISFDPPPRVLLRPHLPHAPLTTLSERCRLLHAAGAAEVLVLVTTPGLLNLQAETFFREVLRGRLEVTGIVEGHNFAFGKDRGGTPEKLKQFCGAAGLPLVVVPPVEAAGAPVSSSRIRQALARGDVAEARACLGRPHAIVGMVGTGAKRGRTLGFPTANLEQVENLLPAEGVYAVRAEVDGVRWHGAANLGPNPTFGEANRKFEVHLIGYQGDLYGRKLPVEFLTRLRSTEPFASVDGLKAQLAKDIEAAKAAAATEDGDAS